MRRLPPCSPARLVLALFFALTALGQAQVYISEFMALNLFSSVVDEENEHSDWVELHNASSTTVNLNGWYLTDNPGDLRKWQFPVATPAVGLAPDQRIVVFASGKNRKVQADRLHTNFKLESSGGYLALVRPDGITVEHTYTHYPQQIQDVSYGLPSVPWQAVVAEGAAGKAKVPLSAEDMGAGWNSSATFDDSSWQTGQSGFGYDTAGTYGALIGTGGDLQAVMYNVNSTALVRFVFNVANPAALTALRLQMKYDDGFVCYLNGTMIAQSNAPETLAYNSSAASDRNGALTQNSEVFNLPTARDALVAGGNVLAIQLLNYSNGSTPDTDNQNTPNGSRALVLPMLEATSLPEPTYLTTATAKLANSAARTNVGPLISETTNKVPRPLGTPASAPILITAKVLPSLRPVASVKLKYCIMFETELSLDMVDDGTAGDAVAGDKIYTVQMPTSALPAGQMIRWRVVASDNAANTSADPPFLKSIDNDQYYGTVALESQTANSQLPVMHWFVKSASASQTEGGTRCSLFFLDRFYDNVFVGLHGQSSSGFPVAKKSHDFNFNKDNRFLWKEGEKRQRAVNLITTWADKSKVRDTIAWESWKEAGHVASHWDQLIRVQQNGNFWGIYDMVENGDEDFLERAGLDSAGALYKMYNSLESAAGNEKKTREFENNFADLQALITGLDPAKSLTVRRQYAYDNVDVASLVNYLANNVLILNNDFGHKNYYVYRDSNGTGEWSVLPWDQDLSLGHTWTDPQNYFNDDIHSQAALVIGAASGNRLMNLIMNGNTAAVAPEMAQMFLRRLRTLMDTRLMPPNSTDSPIERRIKQLLDLMDPPDASFKTDADEDLQKWGYWLDGGGGSQISPNNAFDAATHDHGPRKHALRIINSNPVPPYPGAVNNQEGLGNTTQPFLVGRRARLYNGNLTLANLRIPSTQPAVPTGLTIEQVEFNPASGSTEQEFFVIKNANSTAIDISGWKITGAVDYTFRGGTVIPPGGGATQNVGLLHVARNPKAFRQRTAGPKGGEFRFVTGGYDGRLSARGGTIELRNMEGTVVTSKTFEAAPTPAQDSLRVTEVNYAPVPPTATETAALPGVQASDFEFVELINTGASPLPLGGVQFDRGITFSFPAGFTLEPGARTVVVASQVAFTFRYGNVMNIAGQFEGNLSNTGEQLRILDSVGEEVLRFTYSPEWYPTTAGGGASLVARSSNPAFDAYNASAAWQPSIVTGGTPGAAEPPILTTPASGTQSNGAINVSFALPQNASPGSLKLVFDDGQIQREFALATSEESAGDHSFTFDAANPTASAAILSGNELPDGVFSVRLFYRDSAANPMVRSGATSVRIDRRLPVITVPENQIVEATSAAGATVVYPEASATDNVGVANVNYSQASGTVFPLGSTTVTVTATDGAGNVSDATFTVTVRDTTAPAITSAPAERVLEAGANGTLAMPDLRGELVSTDNVGVVTVEQTPAPGTLRSLGTHLLTFVVADAAGNSSSATTSVTISFFRPTPHADAEVVRLTGAAAPGAGEAGGPPAGSTIAGFSTPALSTYRDLVARVTLQAGRTKLDGIHLEDGAGTARLLAFKGSPAPGTTPAATFASFGDPIISSGGAVAFAAKVKGGGVTAKSDEGIWTTAFTGELVQALREGDAAPGVAGAVLDKVISVSVRDGEILALVSLRKGTGGATAANDMALLRYTVDGGELLLREGAALDVNGVSATVKTFSVLSPGLGSPGHGRWHGDEKVVAKVVFTDKREAVVTLASGGAASALLVANDPAGNPDDGMKWERFGLPAMDSHGANFAVCGTLLRGAGGVTASNDSAVTISVNGGPFVIAAREASSAPDANGAAFAAFLDPLVNNAGKVAFLATLQGAGSNKANKTGLWSGSAENLKMLARAGDPVPDADAQLRLSQFWKAFVSVALPDGSDAGPIFLATVKGSGVNAKNNLGLWGVDSAGQLREFLRTGDQLTVDGQSRTVAKMQLLNSLRGVFGATRSFNDTGSVALQVTFTDKSQAVLRLDLP